MWGYNKGQDAIGMARLLSRNRQISIKDWMAAIDVQKGTICGVPRGVMILPTTERHVVGQVHCV